MGIYLSLLALLIGCGVFISGMNMLSDGLEKATGTGLKKLLGKISNNRFAGVCVGAAVTALIQSSSATSVMTIGFVNAGIMNLSQAMAIIMGANVGTTVTGVLVAFSSLDISIYFSLLTFIGVVLMFFKKDSLKNVGGILCGFGLLFVGLDLMGNTFKTNVEVVTFFENIFKLIDFPLLLILFGALFTALIQSSSAATGVIIALVGSKALGVGDALFIVLGSNIGTCVTALLASLGTGKNAKRTALLHFTFNLIGTVVFTVFIWCFKNQVVDVLEGVLPENEEMQIAWFHVVFNLTTTLLLLPFIKQLVQFSEFVIRDEKDDIEVLHLKYVDDRLLSTPQVALMQVKKEVEHMASLAQENLAKSFIVLTTQDNKDQDEIMKRENLINFTNNGITRFLIKLSSHVDQNSEKVIGSYFHVVNDIERIGDHAKNFLDIGVEMKENELKYSDVAIEELNLMYNKLVRMFEIAMQAFDGLDSSNLDELTKLEEEVDEIKRHLTSQHFLRLSVGECKMELSAYYHSTVSGFERVGDHLINIGYSILNPTGSQAIAKKQKQNKKTEKKPS